MGSRSDWLGRHIYHLLHKWDSQHGHSLFRTANEPWHCLDVVRCSWVVPITTTLSANWLYSGVGISIIHFPRWATSSYTFIPERFPFRYALYNGTLMPCDFFCDYTAPAGTTCLDTSPAGCNSGPAWRTLHHGTLGNDYGNAGAVAEQPLSERRGIGRARLRSPLDVQSPAELGPRFRLSPEHRARIEPRPDRDRPDSAERTVGREDLRFVPASQPDLCVPD